jgi:hypothetical protein
VHSSTSSFERAVPGGRWGATWLVVAVVVVAAVVRFELFVRSRGYQPSVKDDEYAWAWQRGRASDGSPHTIALLGSSRIMLAFSPSAFTEVLPGWRYVQLGINGTTPIGALLDLARDPAFRGVALVDLTEPAFYRVSWHAQDRYIETYHRRFRAVGAMAERRLATYVQSRIAMLATRGVHTFGKLWRTGRWPNPPYVTTFADRTRYADFSLTDVARQRSNRVELIKTWDTEMGDPEPWLAEALEVEDAVTEIQARGGKVVYVRMPTCDERWTADERQAPKAKFWDVLAARTSAATIHFKDDPVLASFPCPDTSHIASKDGHAFTRRLLQLLRDRGVLAVDAVAH